MLSQIQNFDHLKINLNLPQCSLPNEVFKIVALLLIELEKKRLWLKELTCLCG